MTERRPLASKLVIREKPYRGYALLGIREQNALNAKLGVYETVSSIFKCKLNGVCCLFFRYAQSGVNGCSKCPPNGESLAVLFITFILAAVFCLVLSCLTLRSENKIIRLREAQRFLSQEERENLKGTEVDRSLAMIKIVLTFMQVNMIILNLDIHIPSPLTELIESSRAVVAAGSSMGSFACLVGPGDLGHKVRTRWNYLLFIDFENSLRVFFF